MKKILLGFVELVVLREKVEEFRDGSFKIRGDVFFFFMFVIFIFDFFCLLGDYMFFLLYNIYRD